MIATRYLLSNALLNAYQVIILKLVGYRGHVMLFCLKEMS